MRSLKELLLTILVFSFLLNSSQASIVRENENSYVVTAVRAEGASFENEQSTKQIALKHVQQRAFNDVVEYLKLDDITIDDANIGSAISSYTISDEYYNDSFYSIIANFTFDKEIIKSLLKQKRNIASEEIADYMIILQEKDDIIKEYMQLNSYFKKEKITSYPIKIEIDKITVLAQQVSESKVYSLLKELNLNGKVYLN